MSSGGRVGRVSARCEPTCAGCWYDININRLTDTRWDKGHAVIKGDGKAVIAAVEASVNEVRIECKIQSIKEKKIF